MNRRLFTLMLMLAPFAGWAQFDNQPQTEKEGITGGATIGAVTADGKNYQQAGARVEIPIWKFGIGLDVQLLFDENGKIREEDWDQAQDYLDKIYYLRYGKKGEPFYIKFGSLQYSTLGFGNIVKDYSNMLEYPTYKRWGMEMSFKTEKFGGEFLVNDYKEAFAQTPGALVAGRLTYKPLGDLTVGLSAAADLNEYNGFRDTDGDGVPDDIDFRPTDKAFASEYDYWLEQTKQTFPNKTEAEQIAFVDDMVSVGKISGVKGTDMFNIKNARKKAFVYSADISYPFLDGDMVKLQAYAHATYIQDHGYGVAPGLRFDIGKSLSLYAEYRRASKEFMFGYINSTYDLERANFIKGTNEVYTKQDRLEAITTDLNGYFVGADLRLANILTAGLHYQDLIGTDGIHQRTIRGEAGLAQDLIPMISDLKAYYFQDNVQDFRSWKTPSTVMGILLGYNMNGTVIGIDYRFTFKDLDGSGKIDQSNETIKTIAFRTRVTFGGK